MVLVSHDHAFIFLKTRKTAGTSIEMALEPLCRPAGAVVTEKTPAIETAAGVVGRRLSPLSPRVRAALPVDWRNHMPAAEIRDALGGGVWARYLKVTAVRDPFDVAVSRYHWERARRGLAEAADFAQTRAEFAAMATDPGFDGDHDLVHVDAAFAADRTIRYERLAEDLRAVTAAVAPGAAPAPLAHAKPTADRRRRPLADYYDAASIAAVRRAFAWAFDRFDYPDRPTPDAPARATLPKVPR